MQPYLSVVVPVYNSQLSLTELHQRLTQVLKTTGRSYEIIMVDDGSRDDSYSIMKKLRQGDPRVGIIRLQGNFGQHAATLCGFQYCRGQVVVTLDDDLQNPPEEIPRLLDYLQEGFDVVFGIPIVKYHSFYRNWGSSLINRCLAIIFPQAQNLRSSSMRVLTIDLVRRILERRAGHVYLAALIFQDAERIGNVSVKHEPRRFGSSNYDLAKSIKLASTLLINYSDIPLRLVQGIWAMALLTCLTGSIILIAGDNYKGAVYFLLSGLCIITGIGLLTAAVIRKYLVALQQEAAAARKPYIIAELDLEAGE